MFISWQNQEEDLEDFFLANVRDFFFSAFLSCFSNSSLILSANLEMEGLTGTATFRSFSAWRIMSDALSNSSLVFSLPVSSSGSSDSEPESESTGTGSLGLGRFLGCLGVSCREVVGVIWGVLVGVLKVLHGLRL